MTTAEKFILMGNLSMKDGKHEQAIINYRGAVMSGDAGQRTFAIARSAKCYYALGKFNTVIELTDLYIEKYGIGIQSKALLEVCADACKELGFNDRAEEYLLRAQKIERDKNIRSNATSGLTRQDRKQD